MGKLEFDNYNSYLLLLKKKYLGLNQFFFSLPEETDHAAFDDESAAVIRLNNSTILYMKEINKVLALVCILREENFTKPGTYIYIVHA